MRQRITSITAWATSPKHHFVTIRHTRLGQEPTQRHYYRCSGASLSRLAMVVYDHQLSGWAKVRPTLAMIGWHAEVQR